MTKLENSLTIAFDDGKTTKTYRVKADWYAKMLFDTINHNRENF